MKNASGCVCASSSRRTEKQHQVTWLFTKIVALVKPALIIPSKGISHRPTIMSVSLQSSIFKPQNQKAWFVFSVFRKKKLKHAETSPHHLTAAGYCCLASSWSFLLYSLPVSEDTEVGCNVMAVESAGTSGYKEVLSKRMSSFFSPYRSANGTISYVL